MEKYAVIVAGGSGSRMGTDIPKQFLLLHGKPVLMHTLERFASLNIKLILVLPQAQLPIWENLVEEQQFGIIHARVVGGATRFQSVRNGLDCVPYGALVAVHDGVRPFVTPELIQLGFSVAEEKGNAIAAVLPKDSLRRVLTNGRNEMADRSAYRMVQTPQTFRSSLLKEAFKVEEQAFFTDDASVVEYAGHDIHLIEGDYRNIKITTPEDMPLASILAKDFQ